MNVNKAAWPHTTGQISTALKIPAGTFTWWEREGVLKSLDSPSTTMGRTRRFTDGDLYQIAILRCLCDHGVDAHFAAFSAKKAVDAINEFGDLEVQTLELTFIAGNPLPKLRIYGPSTTPPPSRGTVLTTKLDLVPFLAWVKSRITATQLASKPLSMPAPATVAAEPLPEANEREFV